MLKTKLATTLCAFSAEDWAHFRKHLLGFTSESTHLYVLFACYFKHRSRIEKLSENNLQSHPQLKSLTSKGLSNLSSRLLQEVDAWLILSELYLDPYNSNIILIKALNKRGLYNRADQEAKKTEARIKNTNHINLLQTEALADIYYAQYYSNNPIKRTKGNTLFNDCVSHFALSTVEKASKLRLELANASEVKNKAYTEEKKLLAQLMNLTEGTALTHLFKLTLELFDNPSRKAFYELKKILGKGEIDRTSDLELIMVSYATRIAMTLYKKNIIPASEIIEVTQLKFSAIEKHSSQKLLPVTFFNGVEMTAFHMTYAETSAFIDKWKHKVYTKYPKSLSSFAAALNAFYHERYRDLPQLLRDLEFEDKVYLLTSRALLVITFYKMGEEDLMMTIIQNLRRQIKRHQDSSVSNLSKKALLNLMDIIILLQKGKYDPSININLTDHSPIYYKSWAEKELSKKTR